MQLVWHIYISINNNLLKSSDLGQFNYLILFTYIYNSFKWIINRVKLFSAPRLTGSLGVSLPNAIGPGVEIDCSPTDPTVQCYSYDDYANLTVTDTRDDCTSIVWTSTYSRRLEDCYNVGVDDHMYGSHGLHWMYWPINPDAKDESPFTTGGQFGGLIDSYWLFSKGASIHVDEDNALFVSK